MILSDKSSGSSMLQRELARHPAVNLVQWTRHQENETLYWNKAAIVLGMPHEKLHRSALPMPRTQALEELVEFLDHNLPDVPSIDNDGSWLFAGWRALCEEYGPVFLEKSPHHIHCISALGLIRECARRYPEVNFRFIGLVRNPIATLYSMWNRWNIHPDKKEKEWIKSHNNLMKFVEDNNRISIILKYEEVVRDPAQLHAAFEHLNLDGYDDIKNDIHGRSVDSWKRDGGFRWEPSKELVRLAESFGYTENDLETLPRTWSWTLTSNVLAWIAGAKSVRRSLKMRVAGRRPGPMG